MLGSTILQEHASIYMSFFAAIFGQCEEAPTGAPEDAPVWYWAKLQETEAHTVYKMFEWAMKKTDCLERISEDPVFGVSGLECETAGGGSSTPMRAASEANKTCGT